MLQGVVLAEGLTPYATGRIVLIRRIEVNKVQRYATTYEELLEGADGLDSFLLESGDIIHAE